MSVPAREAGREYDLHVFVYAEPVGDVAPRPGLRHVPGQSPLRGGAVQFLGSLPRLQPTLNRRIILLLGHLGLPLCVGLRVPRRHALPRATRAASSEPVSEALYPRRYPPPHRGSPTGPFLRGGGGSARRLFGTTARSADLSQHRRRRDRPPSHGAQPLVRAPTVLQLTDVAVKVDALHGVALLPCHCPTGGRSRLTTHACSCKVRAAGGSRQAP